jgi:hypothetical protein
MKKLDAYLASDEGQREANKFRLADRKKTEESLKNWKKVSSHNNAIDQAAWKEYIDKQYPLAKTIIGESSNGKP